MIIREAQQIKMAVCLLSFVALISCNDEPETQSFILSQESLDAATISYQTGITGDPFSAFSDEQIFGSTDPAIESKTRNLYSNGQAGAPVVPGSIFVRRAYNKNTNVLINTVVMVKHEEGFNEPTKDWEFVNMAYDPTVDYSLHPNGILPDLIQTDIRGVTLNKCVNCHKTKADTNNWLFSTR